MDLSYALHLLAHDVLGPFSPAVGSSVGPYTI